jgi:hypothetical protein
MSLGFGECPLLAIGARDHIPRALQGWRLKRAAVETKDRSPILVLAADQVFIAAADRAGVNPSPVAFNGAGFAGAGPWSGVFVCDLYGQGPPRRGDLSDISRTMAIRPVVVAIAGFVLTQGHDLTSAVVGGDVLAVPGSFGAWLFGYHLADAAGEVIA